MTIDVQIITKDKEISLSDHDIYAKDFIVASIALRPYLDSIEGRSGTVDYGADYDTRTIKVPFYIKAHDLHDFALLRDELFSLVVSRESFYIRELRRAEYQAYNFTEVTGKASNNPRTDNKFVGGKRYKVRLTNAIELEQMLTVGEGELVFETTELPFAESIGTTAEIDKNGLRYSDELWSYGMGLSYDEETHKYTHNTNTFRIYNAGNVEVHPFEMDLKIVIANATKGYKLTNTTTGDVFEYAGETGGTIELNGANVTVNSLQAFRDTNRRYITLAPGWNTFTQTQAREVKFDFRFYYK